MSAYDIRPGGSLKLKGGVAEGGIVKKKKKSKSKSDIEKDKEREKVKQLLFREDKSGQSSSGSGNSSPAPGSSSKKTEAEKRFEEVQKRRLAERVAKLASKTHKERVSDFNKHLETLSEHHDIPKTHDDLLLVFMALYRYILTTICTNGNKGTGFCTGLIRVEQLCLCIVILFVPLENSNAATSSTLSFIIIIQHHHPTIVAPNGGNNTLCTEKPLVSAVGRNPSFWALGNTVCLLIHLQIHQPPDLEDAILSQEPNDILSRILQHFILNLKPQTRNVSKDQIAATVASVLAEYFKTSERTIFWNEDLRRNVDPFESLEGGFFTASWDFKLKILRQLVELQLCHNADIRATIDRAWGVSQSKHKKKDPATAPPEASDPKSHASLQLVPIGQDSKRTRYWIADDSPRVFTSTNPWKITAGFNTVSTTRDDYLALIESLEASKPPDLKKGERRSRIDAGHMQLISALRDRVEAIDEELERVVKVRKRIEQRELREQRKLLFAQTEVRETRTRRQKQRPDYVYANAYDSEASRHETFLSFIQLTCYFWKEDVDEYTYQEEDVQDEEFDEDDFLNFREAPNDSHKRRAAASTGERRRSTRTTAGKLNSNGKRESSAESWSHWRGERRSSRLAPEANFDPYPAAKRARTDDSNMSTNSVDAEASSTSAAHQNGIKLKKSGAAALKPNEIAMEQIAGKKKSKFWVYAVEPVSKAPQNTTDAIDQDLSPSANGSANGDAVHHPLSPDVYMEFDGRSNDLALISLFDQPASLFKPTPLSTTGLFGHPTLTHPDALISLAEATSLRAQLLTGRILRARESRDELLKVVKNLDRLSDLLCGVIDLSELIRNVHPDPLWVRAADHAYDMLCELMNVLNTHVGLYEVLKAVVTDPSIVSTLSPEAHKTALIFWLDFEKSAIDLPSSQRKRFVSLSSDILTLGREFLSQVNSARPPATIKPSELAGLKDNGTGVRMKLQAQFTQRDLHIYPGSMQAHMIMRAAPLEEPRRRLYIAANSSTPEQIETLEKLLKTRYELATLVGRESYAAMTLADKMAKTPANVLYFLDALLDHTRPFAQKALEALQARKQTHHGMATLPTIQAWDRDFYCPPEPPAPPIPLPPLTLGTVFMGLSRLFRHLY
ncbi:hypothetical protein H0H93_004968, partial [Arthromyces matolae]